MVVTYIVQSLINSRAQARALNSSVFNTRRRRRRNERFNKIYSGKT